jgi:RNA polymerase sigma factor (TIGR02999 family)
VISAKQETTQLLLQLADGDSGAAEHLFSRLYPDLRRRAQLEFRWESPDHTWQPTALVHEAFLRMVDQRRARSQNRAHFCAIAARVMRRILVDHAREKGAERRGGGWKRELAQLAQVQVSPSRIEDVLLVDQMIDRLSATDPRQAEIVQLRFFGGLTVPEVAKVMGASRRSIEAEWTMIRAMLRTMAAGA